MYEGTEDGSPEEIELRIAAVLTNLPIIRSLAASIAMRADFDLDSIADLRLAVDEACSTLITQGAPNAMLRCTFQVSAEEIRFVVSVPSTSDAKPSSDSFGWRVLSTLTDHTATWVDGPVDSDPTTPHQVHIELAKRRMEGLPG
ncbi:ATP-binding protein [Actinophytocola sp.]|uniref:ATP-binding protein n=1 Tax=Actinophytocola sp. TaxID=1872138 RepID=UPI00389A25F2